MEDQLRQQGGEAKRRRMEPPEEKPSPLNNNNSNKEEDNDLINHNRGQEIQDARGGAAGRGGDQDMAQQLAAARAGLVDGAGLLQQQMSMMDPQASAMEQLLSMQAGATATGLGVGGANAAALAADPIALQQYRQHLLLSQSALSPFIMGGGGLDPRLLGFGQQRALLSGIPGQPYSMELALLARQQEQQALAAMVQGGNLPQFGQGIPGLQGGAMAAAAATASAADSEVAAKKDNTPGPIATAAAARTTGQKVRLLFMPCDAGDLSEYQCLVRKQIEAFEASDEDMDTNARGRNRAIVRGQVGIRCRHCKVVPPQHRQRAALYYPSKLERLYQMSQTIASVHLLEHCDRMPKEVRDELVRLRQVKSAALGGKKYWADAGKVLGLAEEDKRLFYLTGN